MSAKLIETAAALRKISAENKAQPDAIDEAADLLDAAAKAETVAMKCIRAVRRFGNEMRSLAGMKIDHNCTSEQFVNVWKARANIWLSELAEDLPDLDSGDCATTLAAIDESIDHWRTKRKEASTPREYLTAACYVDAYQSLRVSIGFNQKPVTDHLKVGNDVMAITDTGRLEWLMLNVSGAEFRRLGVIYDGNCCRDRIDAAMMGHNAGVTGLPPAQTVELPPKPAGGRSELT